MEKKSISFEAKDFSKEKRTAVIAHAVYNNIDRTNDISVKGMFNSSWKRGDDVAFYFNHDDNQTPGKVLRTFEDEEKAYTEVKFGNYTLGNDVLEMVDFGVIRGASFGYNTEKKDYIEKGGKRVRKLLQVKHIETSLLTKDPANPLAGVVSYNKSIESKQLNDSEKSLLIELSMNDQSSIEALIRLSGSLSPNDDLYEWVVWNISRRAEMMTSIRSQLKYNAMQVASIKSHVDVMERFCRETKASDECIKSVLESIEDHKKVISLFDTASTPEAKDGGASVNGDVFKKQLSLLHLQLMTAQNM